MDPTGVTSEPPIRARIPADLDTPDQLVAGFTARQLALLGAVVVPGYGLWVVLNGRVPGVVLGAGGALVGALTVAVALGRRDGLSLDRWLIAALAHGVRPRRLTPSPAPARLPRWAPTGRGAQRRVGVLRLPAQDIGLDGIIATGPNTATVLVAATTVSAGLHTPTEQAALLGGYARWLNSLTGPVQVLVSARRIDLGARAIHVAETAHLLAHPALAQAAIAHAEHLLDLNEDGDRLSRTITIATTATGGGASRRVPHHRSSTGRPRRSGAGAEATRRAERTASALNAIGSRSRILSGPDVSALLVAATDPYAPGDLSTPRTPPDAIVTADPQLKPSRVQNRPAPAGRARPTEAGGRNAGRADRYEDSWNDDNWNPDIEYDDSPNSRPGLEDTGVEDTGAEDTGADRAPSRTRVPAGGCIALNVGPSAVRVEAGQLRVGDGWAATLVVTGYPPEVGMSWLEPVLTGPGRVDAGVHIDPIPTPLAVNRLRKQRARLESARRIGAERGRLDDPLVEAMAADAADLADLVARGQSRLFSVGIYLTVHARTRHELTESLAQVRAAAASVLLDTQPATWRHLHGWVSTLPLGHDGLGLRRVMDTDALAASFPLGSPDLPGPLPGESDTPGGVLYGLNLMSGSVVWWDRWPFDNHNSVVLAHSGAGKSYLMKLEVLRNLYDRTLVAVVDPEDEYTALADAVGGSVIRLGAPGARLNPFDLPAGDRRPDALTRRVLFLHTLISVLLGQLSPGERAVLDRAVTATYAAAGITPDPGTWTRAAPLMRDLSDTLTRQARPDPGEDNPGEAASGTASVAASLAARLQPWVSGSFNDLFDGPSTVTASGALVVWSTRHLPDELRPAGMLLALDSIWRDIDTPPDAPAPRTARFPSLGAGSTATSRADGSHLRGGPAPARVRRLVVVDEAWTLMRETEGARFLARMAKSARKRRAGLAVVTQDATDLLSSDLGQIVVANSATQILMRQAPQAIDTVAAAFALSAGESRMLMSAERGQALLLSGTHRVPFVPVASDTEHVLAAGWADLPEPSSPWPDQDPPTPDHHDNDRHGHDDRHGHGWSQEEPAGDDGFWT